jgi:glycylpeptide N-tetradecanoyltransferase
MCVTQACYSFYNFANTVKFEELIRNALILAKKENFDVYNCLDIMENASIFEVQRETNVAAVLYDWRWVSQLLPLQLEP